MLNMCTLLQVASPSVEEAEDEQLSEPGTPRFATPAKGRKGDPHTPHTVAYCVESYSKRNDYVVLHIAPASHALRPHAFRVGMSVHRHFAESHAPFLYILHHV